MHEEQLRIMFRLSAIFQIFLISCSLNSFAERKHDSGINLESQRSSSISKSDNTKKSKYIDAFRYGNFFDNLEVVVNKLSVSTSSKGIYMESPNRETIKFLVSETGIIPSSKYLIDFLPSGFVKDGSEDYTVYIQNAVNQFDNLVFPSFPLLINDSGLKIGSNKIITFLKGSEIRLKPSLKKSYFMLDINKASNVILYNPVIIGDRYTHLGTTGEWGMGLSIRGSSNIKVYGARISNCWGDGIYIDGKHYVPKNILIKDAVLKKNRRDGISVISVDGLILENVYAGYQDGTKPMCGINFETDNSNGEIKNITVINPRTEHNKGNGIQIGISTMLGGSAKHVDIKILNHVDEGSKSFAFKISAKKKKDIAHGSIAGSINIINPSWNSTLSGNPFIFTTDQLGLKVKISSPSVKNSKGTFLNPAETKALLKKYVWGDLEYSAK